LNVHFNLGNFIDEFMVYPNPVNTILNIKITQSLPVNPINIVIFTPMGNRVIEQQINSQESKIDLSYFPKGFYFLQINSEVESKTFKIIKE
jgi:hypothetical protein